MEKLTVTALRKHLYEVVDRVLATGVPVEVERHGRTILISPLESDGSILSRLERRHGIVGDPEELVSIEVTQWHEPDNLD